MPDIPDEHLENLERTLILMREAGWITDYSFDGGISVNCTEKGDAALAVLRKLGLEIGLDKDAALPAPAFWVAVHFGIDPDISRN